MIGWGKRFGQVLEEMRRVQRYPHTNILISGESGTGKELVARAIHLGSENASEPFVPVNCSTLHSDDGEGQLYGGVGENGVLRKGYFDLAGNWTLFLDEIEDMPLIIQSKLLSVLEDGYIVPAGSAEGRKINVRVIVSTNTDLPDRVAKGSFRQDLYYRLMQFHIRVPPCANGLRMCPCWQSTLWSTLPVN